MDSYNYLRSIIEELRSENKILLKRLANTDQLIRNGWKRITELETELRKFKGEQTLSIHHEGSD